MLRWSEEIGGKLKRARNTTCDLCCVGTPRRYFAAPGETLEENLEETFVFRDPSYTIGVPAYLLKNFFGRRRPSTDFSLARAS